VPARREAARRSAATMAGAPCLARLAAVAVTLSLILGCSRVLTSSTRLYEAPAVVDVPSSDEAVDHASVAPTEDSVKPITPNGLATGDRVVLALYYPWYNQTTWSDPVLSTIRWNRTTARIPR
jgi:hypothetical protein